MIYVEIHPGHRMTRYLFSQLVHACRNCRRANLIVIQQTRIMAFRDKKTEGQFYFTVRIGYTGPSQSHREMDMARALREVASTLQYEDI